MNYLRKIQFLCFHLAWHIIHKVWAASPGFWLFGLCKSCSPTPRHCGAISHIVYIKDNADIVNPRDGKIIIRFENFQTWSCKILRQEYKQITSLNFRIPSARLLNKELLFKEILHNSRAMPHKFGLLLCYNSCQHVNRHEFVKQIYQGR